MADEPQDSGELSQEDIDALFSLPGMPGVPDMPEMPSDDSAGGAGGATITVQPDVEHVLGRAAMSALGALASQAADVLTVGIDSVAGQHAALVDATISVTDYASVAVEYGDTPHIAAEIRVSFPPEESYLLAALVPLEDLGALLSLELSAEQLADAAFAEAQTMTMSGSVRELLDLVSITLFAGGLGGVEATLSELRIGQITDTMATLEATSPGAPAVRLQLALARNDGGLVLLTLLIPVPLIDALSLRLVSEDIDDEPELPEPTPLRPRTPVAPPTASIGDDAPGFGLGDDPVRLGSMRPASTFGATATDDVDVHPVRFPPLGSAPTQTMNPRSLDLIMDVSMRVTVELGRSTMTVEDVLALGPGSVIELNKLAGEPVDILVNDQLIARGEVVVVDENFGVRVTEIVSPRRRARVMGE